MSQTSAIAWCFERGLIQPGDDVQVLGGKKDLSVEQLPKLLRLAARAALTGAIVKVRLEPEGFLNVELERRPGHPGRLEVSPALLPYLPKELQDSPQAKKRRRKPKGFGHE